MTRESARIQRELENNLLIALETLLAASIAVIAWCYLGYPIYLWVSTSLQRQGSATLHQGDFPGVSLIISAYNESAVIHEKLDNAASLSYPQELLEIIVVSDAPDDAQTTSSGSTVEGKSNLAAGIGVATYIMGQKYISWSPDRTTVQEGEPRSPTIQDSDDLRS